MESIIRFKNLEPQDHLREFVADYLEKTIAPFVRNRPLRARVIIETGQFTQKHLGHPDFLCEIVLYHPAIRRPIIAKKSSVNFYKSVKESCRAVEKSLRRLARTKLKHRRSKQEPAISAFSSDILEEGVLV